MLQLPSLHTVWLGTLRTRNSTPQWRVCTCQAGRQHTPVQRPALALLKPRLSPDHEAADILLDKVACFRSCPPHHQILCRPHNQCIQACCRHWIACLPDTVGRQKLRKRRRTCPLRMGYTQQSPEQPRQSRCLPSTPCSFPCPHPKDLAHLCICLKGTPRSLRCYQLQSILVDKGLEVDRIPSGRARSRLVLLLNGNRSRFLQCMLHCTHRRKPCFRHRIPHHSDLSTRHHT